MFRIICILKSNQSYKRIVSKFDNAGVAWEDNISSLDILQDKAVYTTYNLAVIDEKITWFADATAFLNKMNVPYLLFTGDFEDIVTNIKGHVPQENTEEEVLNFSTEEVAEVIKEEPIPERIRIVKDIEYVDREVPVPVYKSMYGGIDQQIVVIANLSRRAGASFLTANFARMLARLKVFTCVIEPPLSYPYMFNAIGIDVKIDAFKKANKKNAAAPDFYSYPHAIFYNELLLKNREAIIDDIIWAVPDPRLPLIHEMVADKAAANNNNMASLTWDYYKMMKLVSCTKGAPIKLVDVGSHISEESITHFLPEADLILIVVDPMPADCLESRDKLSYIKSLKEKGLPIKFIANKWAPGIDAEYFFEYLQEDLLMKVPYVPANYIYQALFEFKMPYDIPEVEDLLSRPFTDLAKLLVPMEILTVDDTEPEEHTRKPFNLLSNLLRRKKE